MMSIIFFEPLIDMFARFLNKQCPLFVSPFPDNRAWKIDALSFQWENLAAYAFPPFARVGKVVEQLSTSVNTQIILVAPCWPDRNWFQELLSLLIDHPRQLPEWDNLLHQPRLGKHHNIRMLRLHAWRISSDISLIRDFRKELPFFVARAQRKSKMAVYDSNWSRFVGWCSEREIDPFTVAISSIAEF